VGSRESGFDLRGGIEENLRLMPSDSTAAVDLRSDTVTKPTPAMRRAMAEAEVGDDVYGEDPTVNRLQERAAEIFQREAALFVPSGSMGNLLAVKTLARPGMEVICEERGHVNQYELASMSAVAGCMPRATPAPDGILTWNLIEPLIRPKTYYYSQSGLITLENTHNMHGGTVYPPKLADEICDRAHAAGIPVHLDGARIFNAAVALGRNVADLTRKFDSVMFCLSKGLGAPVGSMLVGSHEFIDQAHIGRKLLGGGMRQVGVLAAAGLIALEQTPKVLHRDHENARYLAEGLAQIEGVTLDPKKVVTNIVIFDVSATAHPAAEICQELEKRKIRCGATGRFSIRMVTHYDVERSGIDRALAAVHEVVGSHTKRAPARA
jgi:threonine aldolase